MLYRGYNEADVLELEAAETIPSDRLDWPGGSPEQLRFMRRVYDINLQRNLAAGRTFVADVPAAELAPIENGYRARTAAAADCIRLLEAVRREISAQGVNVRVGIASAYRSATEQLRLWQRYFTEGGGYYERTATQRRNLAEGEHSEAAAQLVAAFVRGRIGVPGFSNHNNGLAIDFVNVENGDTLANRTTDEATQRWRRTWLWAWLTTNARRFGYVQNTNINEPWHWEYTPAIIPNGTLARATEALSFADTADTIGLAETGGGTFRRLREADVHYLAFEGGGGKGFVYTGAIKALQEKSILRYSNGRLDPDGPVKGVSGASAGAITAMLVSIGYDATAVTTLMRSNNFNRFFDLPAIPSRVPDINQCRSGGNNFVVRVLQGIVRTLVGLAVPNIGGVRERVEEFIDQRLENFFRSRIDQSDITNGPVDKLMKYPLHYLNDIIADLGIFSGCAAREFIDRLLLQKTNQANVTFRQHYELFRIKLVLAGANLERGTSEYFSKDTTPNMPVADAVRISMGLPFIFKPYRISTRTAAQMGNPALAGLWVDGGVRNNLPIRAFENEPGARPHTLGIRLGEETVTPINNIIDLLTALTIRQGLLGSGEAEISRTSGYRQQTVTLPTRGLQLIDFNPPPAAVEPLVQEAHTAIGRYFDQRVPLPETFYTNGVEFVSEHREQTPDVIAKDGLAMDGLELAGEGLQLLEALTVQPPIPQSFLDQIVPVQLASAADINNYFTQSKGTHFITWFNQTLAGRQNWEGKRFPNDSQLTTRFDQLWNNIPVMFNTPSINLVQFAALMSIIINETGGTITPLSERVGRPGHPGIAYAFDRIENVKASYNKPPNFTAFELFNNLLYIQAHGRLPLGNQLSNTTDQVWAGQQYPQDRFPTSTDPAITGFILEADFYKFRGRGFLQTTWRPAYKRIINYILNYTGADVLINQYKQNWAGISEEQIATISTNQDWDSLFQQTNLIIPSRAVYLHNARAGNYLSLPLTSTTLNGTDAGSLHRMGLRISGGANYATLFKNRVLQLLHGLV